MTTDVDQRVRIYHDEPSYKDRYAMVYDWTWEIPLSPKARTLYAYILYRVGANDEHKAWPSRETIAQATRISERCLHDLLHELEHQGMIRIHVFPPRESRPSEYYVQTKQAVFARQAMIQSELKDSHDAPLLPNPQEDGLLAKPARGLSPNSQEALAVSATPESQEPQRLNKDETDTERDTETDTERDTGRVRARDEAAVAAIHSPEQPHGHNGGTGPLEGRGRGTPGIKPHASPGKRGSQAKEEQLLLPGIKKMGPQESRGQAAAREFLRCVKRYEELATIPRSWAWASARMLKEAGPEAFSEFVAWVERLPWLDQPCSDGGQTYRQAMGIPKYEQLWPEFLAQRGKPAPIIPLTRQQSARDAGRITDAPVEGGQSGCALCDRPVGSKHREDCPVLEKGYGPDVEPDQRNGMWCVNHGIRRRSYGAS